MRVTISCDKAGNHADTLLVLDILEGLSYQLVGQLGIEHVFA